jgi:acyl dehydratase
MRLFDRLQDIDHCVGTLVALSPWIEVNQEQVNRFADATGDHQWIHVDPVKARQGPFGRPIAHGFLTLSLMPRFLESSLGFGDVRMGVNYGMNRVRFTAPVPVESRLRAHLNLLASDPIEPAGRQLTWQVQIEREGGDKPVCVAEFLARLYT